MFISAISLASKCSTSAFRMHIRADDTLMKMLSALHDAPQDPVCHYLRNRLPVGGGCVYVLQMFFFVFFPSVKNMRQPFSGTAERIFMKLLPNDTGENVV